MTRDEKKKHQARIQACIDKAIAIVNTGTCPDCGSGLHRNLAITGWHQCDQYGADGFRKDDAKPACSFQCFTA